MKLFVSLCVLSLIAAGMADDDESHPNRGCIYILGRCSTPCPEGTHAYTTGCGYLTPEPTCDEPNPVQDKRGMICDYSACYCDQPTVRDKSINKCVPLEQCPGKDAKEETDESTKQSDN